MKIHFSCNNCGAKYQTDILNSGKKGKCKKCGSIIICPIQNSQQDQYKITETTNNQQVSSRNTTSDSTDRESYIITPPLC
jgi:uncharacterized Zn finger protein